MLQKGYLVVANFAGYDRKGYPRGQDFVATSKKQWLPEGYDNKELKKAKNLGLKLQCKLS